MSQLSSEEKGKKAEALFINYLNDKNIPFLRIDQEKDTKSKTLKEKDIVRYDFLIQTKVGIYYIDVKYREKISISENKEDRFRIGHDKIKLISNFTNEFHQELWIAFTDNLDEPDFYFSNTSCVYNYYEKLQNVYNSKYNFSKANFIYLPNELILFDQLSFDLGFYNELDDKYFEMEAEYLNKHEIEYHNSKN